MNISLEKNDVGTIDWPYEKEVYSLNQNWNKFQGDEQVKYKKQKPQYFQEKHRILLRLEVGKIFLNKTDNA